MRKQGGVCEVSGESRIGAEQMRKGRCIQRVGQWTTRIVGVRWADHDGGGETVQRVSLGMSMPVDARGGEVGGSAWPDFLV